MIERMSAKMQLWFDGQSRYGVKCPRHNKKMTTQCKMMEDDRETPPINMNTSDSSNQGHAKCSRKYFVTDNLEVFPSSDSLALLKKLKVENMSSLDSIELRVGTDEVNTLILSPPHSCLPNSHGLQKSIA